jgi:hypothetical protein
LRSKGKGHFVISRPSNGSSLPNFIISRRCSILEKVA